MEGPVARPRHTLDRTRADAIVEQRIRGSALRPHDIGNAAVDHLGLLYVPFFRVVAAVDGFHVGLSGASVRVGSAHVPIPTGGSRHAEETVFVCARREFPFTTRVARARFGGESPLSNVRLDQLVPASQLDFGDAERVQANVPRAAAEDDAVRAVRRANEPGSRALFAQYDVRVRSVDLWLHPIFLARYRYDGDARRHADEDCYVAVCGRTGAVIAEHHPSAVRSIVARARKFLWE